MKDRYQCGHRILSLISALFVLIQTALFAYTWFRCDHLPDLIQLFDGQGNHVIVSLYALSCFLFYKLFGCFRVGYFRLYDAVFAVAAALLCMNTMTYLQLCLVCRWPLGFHIEPMLWLTVADAGVDILWVLCSRALYARISKPRKLLIIYGEYSPQSLMRKLSSRPDKYRIMEAVSYHMDAELLEDKMRRWEAVVLTDIPSKERNDLLKFCFDADIRCYCVPKISDIMVMNAATMNLFDTTLLLFRNNGISFEQLLIKRAFDMIASALGILLSAPVMALIALCIKLYDGGPVFFRQERLTKDGKTFLIYKFRSMRVEEEKTDYCLTQKNDNRITPVGKVLRNIHFDELPQLFNILKGEMSFVGPRPECPGLTAEYTKMIPQFPSRLKVKAGLTGYAQVYGKYNTTPYDKLKLDLTYIKRFSIWLDLKLMFMTVKILFQKENAEGVESWQTNAATQDDYQKQTERE